MSEGDETKKRATAPPPTICSDCYGYLSTVDGIIAWCPSCGSSWLVSPPVPPEEFGPRGKKP